MTESGGSPFHPGEKALQERLGVSDRVERLGRRMIQPRLLEQQQGFLSGLSLLFIAATDSAGRPWASAVTGAPGFLKSTAADRLRIGALPSYGDPLERLLDVGTRVGTLGLDFQSRQRLRVNGRIAEVLDEGFELSVDQSYGNCDAYIQAREQEFTGAQAPSEHRAVHRGKALTRDEAALVARSDTFLIATQSPATGEWSDGLDISHRGGLPGFVIVAHETSLLFPDYAGTCMFNTLGNLQTDPRAGLLFIDFDTGDTLQLSGEAQVLWEPHHSRRFPGAERVLAFRIDETLRIESALEASWTLRDYSPVLEAFAEPRLPSPTDHELPPMTLVSVNLSMPKEVTHEGKAVTTGIFKTPAGRRVMLRRLNLDGDGQADLWGHGGAFRAVYVYAREHYPYWATELGREDFPLGQFGENFTVEGMLEEDVYVGDVFRVGDALVEVSQPRIPCYKLAIRMGVENFQNRFLKSGRVGFYLRVLEEGEVGPGDAFELVRRDPEGMSVRAVSDLLFFNTEDLEGTRRALSIPALAHGWKGSFEERLSEAERRGQTSAFRDFRVDAKEPESETITSFYLVPTDGAPLARFQPGQFLSLALDIPGRSEALMRTYSLSDSPDLDYYRISVKREPSPADRPELPPGLSSTYLHDQVEVGSMLRVAPPRGKFHPDLTNERAWVLLSAGVGLTPMVSMLNTVARSDSGRRVWFLHQARNGREQAFGEHVRAMASTHENIHVHVRYSRPDEEDVSGRDYDGVGRVDVGLLRELLPFDDYEFFLCGPEAFMRSLYCGLLSTGVAESRIHYEFFGPASALVEESQPRGQAPVREGLEELSAECEVSFERSGMTVAWDAACESVLELAEHQGLDPEFSCRSGICRTCMCRLLEGEVEYTEEPLNAPDPGHVLICVCRPKTSIVVDV